MNGSIVLLDKPPGISSFSALSPIKRTLETKKVGHTGTLDPFAEGLLVVLTGCATRLAPWFSGLDKAYRADIRFGVSTDTLDPEGLTDASGPVPDRRMIEAAVASLQGVQTQRPPEFSAIKISGERAYRKARRGERVEIPEREITIHRLALETYPAPLATISIACSKGTYVRSIARDIAFACGTVAYVSKLKRSSVGPFSLLDLEDSRNGPETGTRPGLDHLRIQDHRGFPIRWRTMRPIEAIRRLGKPEMVEADAETLSRIRFGKPIDTRGLSPEPQVDGVYAVCGPASGLAAIIEVASRSVRYRLVVPEGASQPNN